ncbi:MAG TPA: Verru_Chthon cassette protein A, partial [Candidatus Methylacidiphilales bacterium]
LQPIASPASLSGGLDPVVFGMSGGKCVPANGVYAGTNQTGTGLAYPPGDWDNGFSVVPDGAFINKADEGTTTAAGTPYFSNLNAYTGTGTTLFSPNRQMPSPVMFGSLPTGVNANQPWQTLLFHPDPGGTPRHIGTQSPPDHLFLDLFTMPVVEPYPISDPLSIAGRVNMNYQIVPFTYITRSTGVRAVLKPEQIVALSDSDSTAYKNSNLNLAGRRLFLDLDQTLAGFQARFASGDIFRSASEVCGLWLVPQGQTYSGMPTFWAGRRLTGDNTREKPYADIYPRLTTKSNTYTIHVRVQTLKKSAATDPASWIEGSDAVTGEYRGSTTVERYVDTADTRVPDYATAPNAAPLDIFYKFRVVETKQFTP